MWQSLLPFFQWCDGTWLGSTIRESRLYFPIIETFHLFALTLLFGAILMVNLRIFGLILKSEPLTQVNEEIKPWAFWSLVVILVSGAMLFLSEAMKCFASGPFQIKMAFLFSAIIFHFTIHRYIVKRDRFNPILGKLAAVVSVLLWLGVGVGGRAIGFL
ncbi:MAG TPA: DUF6644 family protein [Terriglobia bacterium]|nr:DUF6644 family protein [Terriglobia bacterium]